MTASSARIHGPMKLSPVSRQIAKARCSRASPSFRPGAR